MLVPSSRLSEMHVALRSTPPSSVSLFVPHLMDNISSPAKVQRDTTMALWPTLLTHKDLSRGMGSSFRGKGGKQSGKFDQLAKNSKKCRFPGGEWRPSGTDSAAGEQATSIGRGGLHKNTQ